MHYLSMPSNIFQIGTKLKTNLRVKLQPFHLDVYYVVKEIPSTIEKRMMFWCICQENCTLSEYVMWLAHTRLSLT